MCTLATGVKAMLKFRRKCFFCAIRILNPNRLPDVWSTPEKVLRSEKDTIFRFWRICKLLTSVNAKSGSCYAACLSVYVCTAGWTDVRLASACTAGRISFIFSVEFICRKSVGGPWISHIAAAGRETLVVGVRIAEFLGNSSKRFWLYFSCRNRDPCRRRQNCRVSRK
jgi:hypothetical protein